ncbi:spore cortex-lytic enzyme [Ammoniphilus oxalaticus]|uniref:Spore cortex-lytic enzyme n=1 Tax=Ammoniphilus oxalaticus TaxID=66863 RepID=A0A419SMP1_9BACL|nr:spore cortex-lytic enzyme [Ammoniphilus oxalaticus]RKD25512.1 spore cortex-lytic enzyme [Ammoniphilus oxalaticus]
MRKMLLTLLVLGLLGTGVGVWFTVHNTETFSSATIKQGATGQDVLELQGRLKFLGFYKGAVDGKFGSGTYWALRNFQHQFGMKVDGVAGSKTKLKLWEATKNWKPGGNTNPAPTPTKPTQTETTYKPHGLSENDLKIMANAVYGEARGEPYIGQVAVAAVILNRVKHTSFPNTPSGVIFEPRAFTAVADGQIWLTPNETAKKAVRDAINGWDPTGKAIYYFNPDTATSPWIWTRPQIKKIGKHIFCN